MRQCSQSQDGKNKMMSGDHVVLKRVLSILLRDSKLVAYTRESKQDSNHPLLLGDAISWSCQALER
jgi:hypothetical protein